MEQLITVYKYIFAYHCNMQKKEEILVIIIIKKIV